MRVLFLTHSLCGIDLAVIVKYQGHDVDVAIFNPLSKDIGNGFGVNKSIDYSQFVQRALQGDYDLVISDDVYMGKDSNLLRKNGVLVFGGSVDTDVWENNRFVGIEIMRQSGIEVPETVSFDSYSAAEAFLKERGGLWVLKGSGSEGLVKGKTVVPKTEEELLWFVDAFKKECDDAKVILQCLLDGIEVAWSFWWNGDDVVGDAWMNFEHKRMFTGDMGPFCGEAGTMVVAIDADFIRERFRGLFSWLRSSGYRGIFDMNTIVTEDGRIYGLEFTPRMGFPIMQCIVRQLLYGGVEDVAEYIRSIASGEQVECIDRSAAYGCVIGYFVRTDVGDLPVFWDGDEDVRELVLRYVGLDDVAWSAEFNCFVAVSGNKGDWYKRVVLPVGVASNYDKAIGRALRMARRLRSTYGWYRTDIGLDRTRYEGVRSILGLQ